MKVIINPRKSPQDNANDYYNKAKKLKKKIPKLKKAIAETEELIKQEKEKTEIENELPAKKIPYKREWYEKFHWSNLHDYLFLAGRDRKTNTEIVKKYMQDDDLYFHADVDGAPSCILKNGQNAPDKIKGQAAVLAGAYSSVWKAGVRSVDVYHVSPEQVKTAAKSGEYMATGAFQITGKREYYKNIEVDLAISFFNDKIMCAPKDFYDSKFIIIVPDKRTTKGKSAKKIFVELKQLFPEKRFELDWIIQVLPNGGSKIKRVLK